MLTVFTNMLKVQLNIMAAAHNILHFTPDPLNFKKITDKGRLMRIEEGHLIRKSAGWGNTRENKMREAANTVDKCE